jgi:hypothetical protein
MHSRRAVLAALAGAGALLTGCLGGGPSGDDGGTDTDDVDGDDDVGTATTRRPNGTVPFPDGPKERPDRPDRLTESTVAEFVRAHEYRYVYNRLWMGEGTAVTLSCEVSRVTPVGDGYRAVVSCTGHADAGGRARENGTGTTTPVHADHFTRTYAYYVDGNSLLRRPADEDGDDTTDAETGTTTTATAGVSTPEPGECSAASPPDPSTVDGLPAPRDYPDRPSTVDEATVRSFVEAYETAYRYNSRLAAVAADGDCLGNLEVRATDVTADAVGEGVEATVTTRGSFTGTNCPEVTGSDTPTPLPHVDFGAETARYYVTDRFAVRERTVVECW